MAPYLFRGRANDDGCTRVVDLVDLDSEKWRTYSAQGGGRAFLYGLEAQRLAESEVALTHRAELTLLVSEAEAADLRRRPGTCSDRVHVVGNGVDAEAYRPIDAPDLVRGLGVDPDRPFALFVGRITRQKGVMLLLAAAEQLPPEVGLVLCAGAPDTPAEPSVEGIVELPTPPRRRRASPPHRPLRRA